MSETVVTMRRARDSRTVWWRRWPQWSPYAASLFSLGYGALGIYWALGGYGFPWGAAAGGHAFFASLRPLETGFVLAVFCFIGALAALLTRLPVPRRWRGVLLVYAWFSAALLIVGGIDERLLTAVAYGPIFLVGAPFGWPPVNYFAIVWEWPVAHQLMCLVGGVLWAAAALACARETRAACAYCGRSAMSEPRWKQPDGAARWGSWAVAVAVAIPLFYASVRWAWVLGIPFGITRAGLQGLFDSGLIWAGAGLATVAACGALLTLGLVRRWGEVFPNWIPWLGGKRVPIWFAVAPASFVSIIVTVGISQASLLGGEPGRYFSPNALLTNPLSWFPLWGTALGVATLAYYFRRRGQCERCGRGGET